MKKVVSVTEAARKFSDILNSIRYRGESYTIVRGGKPVASISPVEAPGKKRLLRELKALAQNLNYLSASLFHGGKLGNQFGAWRNKEKGKGEEYGRKSSASKFH